MKTHTLVALVAGGIGYVLGARAGRTRYDQIRHTAHAVAENPLVRQAAHRAQEAVEERAPEMTERVAAAADKVRPHNGQPTAGWPPDPRSAAQEPTPTYPRTDD